MATKKKTTLSKTDAIRVELEQDAAASPKAVAALLTKRGIKVSPAYVSTIKSADKKRNGKPSKKPGRPSKAALQMNNGTSNGGADKLMEAAFDLVLKAGENDAQKYVQLASRLLHRVHSN